MPLEHLIVLSFLLFLVALLYSSVGHAGASGYIAVLTLAQMPITEIKPIALTLNILVSVFVTWNFYKAGFFSWNLFWPLALFSVPSAWLGGYADISSYYLAVLVGLVLLASSLKLFFNFSEPLTIKPASRRILFFAGSFLGFIAGLTGTGGGIFLSPLLLLSRWAGTKTTAAISAGFILVNSVSGLTGYLFTEKSYPVVGWHFMSAAAIGGTLGSYMGSRFLSVSVIKKILSLVLVMAGIKLLMPA